MSSSLLAYSSMILLRFGTRFVGSDIVRDRFRDLGFRKRERELVRKIEWVEGYEADDLSVFKNFYL